MHEFGSTRGATLTSGTPVIIPCNGASNVLALFRGTSGTVAYKAYISVDGENYTPTRMFNYKTGAENAADSAVTAANDDLYQIPCTAGSLIKLEVSSGAGSTLVDANAAAAGETLQDVSATIGGAIDTELPAAAALADNTANPTAPAVAAFNMVWDGATWDRAPGNSTDGALVNVASGSAIIPRPNIREVTLTFSPDTSIMADNDVIADSQILAAVTRANDSKGFLIAFELTDEDDNTAIDMDIIFLSANVSVGTENAAVSISDANARNIIGVINILAADWNDHINSKMVSVGNKPGSMLSMPITPVSGSDDIYVALVCRSGTPTYTASGITARFWFIDGN